MRETGGGRNKTENGWFEKVPILSKILNMGYIGDKGKGRAKTMKGKRIVAMVMRVMELGMVMIGV